MFSSTGSSQPRDQTQISHIAGGFFTYWGIRRCLEWVAYPFSRGSSPPRIRTWVSCIAGRVFTSCATREALVVICGQWQHLSQVTFMEGLLFPGPELGVHFSFILHNHLPFLFLFLLPPLLHLLPLPFLFFFNWWGNITPNHTYSKWKLEFRPIWCDRSLHPWSCLSSEGMGRLTVRPCLTGPLWGLSDGEMLM